MLNDRRRTRAVTSWGWDERPRSSCRCLRVLCRATVKFNAVNSQITLFFLAVLRKMEANRDSTTALLIGNAGGLRGARGDVPAGGTVRHTIDDIYIRLLRSREVEVGNGEAFDIYTTGDLEARRVTFGDLSFDVFALLMLVYSRGASNRDLPRCCDQICQGK